MFYRRTRPPIQVWSPLIQSSINDNDFKKDLLLAGSLYDEEDVVWLSPKTDKASRWKEDSIRHLIIPAKTINKITVYNIDEMGRIYPSIGKIKKLDLPVYKKWLKKLPKICYRNKPLKIAFPTATKKETYYKDIEIEPDIAFIKGYKKNKEASKYYKERKNLNILDYEIDRFDDFLKETKAPNSRNIWPEPFNDFFVTGGGMNVLYDFYEMRRYIEQYSKNKEMDMQGIRNIINTFLIDIESSLMRCWFLPKFNYFKEDDLLEEIKYKFGLDFNNSEEAKKSKELEKIVNNRIPIKKAYSWLGYFWWEFYQDIIKYNTVKICNYCKGVITGGRQNRIYCTKEENLTCFNERVALRQKKKYDNDQKHFSA